MSLVRLDAGAFSLRDYLAYLFPGLAFGPSIAITMPWLWQDLTSNAVNASLGILVGGYILGFVSHRVSRNVLGPPLNRIFGNPFSSMLSPTKGLVRKKMDASFRRQVQKQLKQSWGEELFGGSEVNMLFLCWRQLQFQQNSNVEYLGRLLDLYNLSRSLIPPILIFSVALVLIGNYVPSVLALATAVLIARARFDFKAAFALNVYRTWYIVETKGPSGL